MRDSIQKVGTAGEMRCKKMSDKQIEEMAYDVCNSSHCTVEEWQCCSVCAGLCEKAKRISEKLTAKGYRKASEVAREIFAEIEKSIADLEYQANTSRKTVKVEELKAQVNWVLHEVVPKTLAELKKKYTAEMKKIKIGEWVYGKFDIPHCSECGYEPTEISPFCPMCNANMESEDGDFPF